MTLQTNHFVESAAMYVLPVKVRLVALIVLVASPFEVFGRSEPPLRVPAKIELFDLGARSSAGRAVRTPSRTLQAILAEA